MSGELQAQHVTGAILYAVLLDAKGGCWNGSAFDSTPTGGEWAGYDVAMAEMGSSGYYGGNLPAVGIGAFSYRVHKQLGGSPATTDPVVWTGTVSTLPDGRTIVDVVESQRGGHTQSGLILYVDGTGGSDTTGDGSRALPFQTITKALTLCSSNSHDLIILLPRAGQNPNVITEASGVTVDKAYTFIRGPGRDVRVTRVGAGPVFNVTANGCELSGMQIITAGAASNAVQVTAADFARLFRVWIENPTQDGVNVAVGTNCRVEGCTIVGAGRDGIRVESGAGTGYYMRVIDSTIRESVGSAISLQGVDASEAQVQRNVIRDNAVGVTVGAGVVDAVITDNRMVNNATPISDAGTRTYQAWNFLATDVNGNITGSVSVSGSAIFSAPVAATLVTGSQVGTYAALAALDASYHQVSDAAGVLDVYYEFNVGTDGIPAQVKHVGRLNGSNDTLTVWAYNWASLTWVRVGTLAGQAGTGDVTRTFDLLSAYVGTGANDGLVRVRFYAASGLTSATLYTDQLLVSYTRVLEGVASQASVDTLLTIVDTEVAAIQEKTNNLPADPASQASTAAAITAAQGALELLLADVAADADLQTVLTALSGVTSLASWLRAIARKDVTEPELGGTYDPATDSLEGQVDTGGAGVTPQTFWTYNGPRTLTMSSRQLGNLVRPSVLYLYRGDTIELPLVTGFNLANRAAVYFTIKHSTADADAAAVVQITEADGLLVLSGAVAGTPADGVVTVDDEGTGQLTIRLEAAAAQELPAIPEGSGGGQLQCDVKVVYADGTVTTVHRSSVVVQADVTRTPAVVE